MYDYSRQFFKRYYRPEYVTIAGSRRCQTHITFCQMWSSKLLGGLERGDYTPDIPREAEDKNWLRYRRRSYSYATLPWVCCIVQRIPPIPT